MSAQLHIDTLYAFIARDDEGEGVMGFMTPNGWLPMVGADLERIESLEPIAQQLANSTNKTVQLVHFTKREEVRLIEPNRTAPGEAVDLGGGVIGLKSDPPPPSSQSKT